MVQRKPISKTVRFEVFKRDSFICKYCGRKAPDVLLQIDHVVALAEGGTDDVLNLVTSCLDCNLGKGARPLSDTSVIDARRAQLEALQERQEQIQMMLDWQRGLAGQRDAIAAAVMDEWKRLAPGWAFSKTGEQKAARLCRTYSLDELFDAMARAAEQYLEFDSDGKATQESWSVAWGKIPRIAQRTRELRHKPWMDRIYHAINILKKRFPRSRLPYDKVVASWLEAHYNAGVDIDAIFQSAVDASSWDEWREEWEADPGVASSTPPACGDCEEAGHERIHRGLECLEEPWMAWIWYAVDFIHRKLAFEGHIESDTVMASLMEAAYMRWANGGCPGEEPNGWVGIIMKSGTYAEWRQKVESLYRQGPGETEA